MTPISHAGVIEPVMPYGKEMDTLRPTCEHPHSSPRGGVLHSNLIRREDIGMIKTHNLLLISLFPYQTQTPAFSKANNKYYKLAF